MKIQIFKLGFLFYTFLFLSCNNNLVPINNAQKESADLVKTEIQDSLEAKSEKITDETNKADDDSIEEINYSIKYMEDFIKFRSHDEIEKFFGSENVLYTREDLGAGWMTNVTYIYDDYENMLAVVWSSDPEEEDRIDFITGNYTKQDFLKTLKPGGNEFTYKSGLYIGMSLEELIALNGASIYFEDFAFNLGRQFIVGMVVIDSLNGILQDYVIHLEYTPKIADYDNLPTDYQYLLKERTVSSDDKNIILTNISVQSILYCPCRCCIYYKLGF